MLIILIISNNNNPYLQLIMDFKTFFFPLFPFLKI